MGHKAWRRKAARQRCQKQAALNSLIAKSIEGKSRIKGFGRGMERVERQAKEPYRCGYGCLRRDVVTLKGSWANQQVVIGSMKVIILKITNPNKESMPFEHLTFNRI
jgi:hypothetical protein